MNDTIKDTEWWWIDYLENELDAGLEKDLEMLLTHSPEDRDSFENFRLLRQWVKASDSLAGIDLETRLRRVRTNVMDEINRSTDFPAPAQAHAGSKPAPRRSREADVSP